LERLAQIALVLMGALAFFAALHVARSFLLPTTLGIILAFMGAPASHRLERWGLPRYAAAGLTILALVIGAVVALFTLMPSIEEWSARAPEIGERLKNDLQALRELVAAVEKATNEVRETVKSVAQNASNEAEPARVVVADEGVLSRVASMAPSLIAMAGYTVILAFFLIAERRNVRAFALRMPRSTRARLRLARTFRMMRHDVSGYLFTIAVINVVVGALAGILFYAVGLPNAPLWAVGVALANFIPFIGPLAMQVVVFIVGYVSFDSIYVAIIAPLALSALHFVEGSLVTPAIVGRRSRLRPLTVFVALAFGAWLWGIGGAFVAVPATIALWTLLRGVLLAPPPPAAKAVAAG
jgi:predicted PurR-regulated permease PerM